MGVEILVFGQWDFHFDHTLTGLRQFFHRMVVCLEEDILPFVPTMVKLMLETPDAKELYDFIPMLTQLVTKFKVGLSSRPQACS